MKRQLLTIISVAVVSFLIGNMFGTNYLAMGGSKAGGHDPTEAYAYEGICWKYSAETADCFYVMGQQPSIQGGQYLRIRTTATLGDTTMIYKRVDDLIAAGSWEKNRKWLACVTLANDADQEITIMMGDMASPHIGFFVLDNKLYSDFISHLGTTYRKAVATFTAPQQYKLEVILTAKKKIQWFVDDVLVDTLEGSVTYPMLDDTDSEREFIMNINIRNTANAMKEMSVFQWRFVQYP